MRDATTASPRRSGCDTSATSSRDRCQEFGKACPHGDHRHSFKPDDPSCFHFLLRMVNGERPAITARSQSYIGADAPRTGGHITEREARRYARAVATCDPAAALTRRPVLTPDGRRGCETAQSLFPLLATINEQLTIPGCRATELHWLKDALLGTPASVLAANSRRDEEDVTRAIYAVSRRICRNELPRRHDDDLKVVDSHYLGT